jgi:hypothetical protein
MKSAAELRSYVDTCHALARKAVSEDERRQLLDMAATWMWLASDQARAEALPLASETGPFCRQVQRSPPH